MDSSKEQRRAAQAAGIRWCGDVRAVLDDDPFNDEAAAGEPKATSAPDAAA